MLTGWLWASSPLDQNTRTDPRPCLLPGNSNLTSCVFMTRRAMNACQSVQPAQEENAGKKLLLPEVMWKCRNFGAHVIQAPEPLSGIFFCRNRVSRYTIYPIPMPYIYDIPYCKDHILESLRLLGPYLKTSLIDVRLKKQ